MRALKALFWAIPLNKDLSVLGSILGPLFWATSIEVQSCISHGMLYYYFKVMQDLYHQKDHKLAEPVAHHLKILVYVETWQLFLDPSSTLHNGPTTLHTVGGPGCHLELLGYLWDVIITS